MSVLAENVKANRLRKAWTQEELAEICDVSVRTIQRVERGEQASLDTQKALAAAFDINVEVLHTTEQTKPVPGNVKESQPITTLTQYFRSRLPILGSNLFTWALLSGGIFTVNRLFYPEQKWQYFWVVIWLAVLVTLEIRNVALFLSSKRRISK